MSRAMRPPKHNPAAKPHCFLTHCSLNLGACFGGNTVQLATEASVYVPRRQKESLELDGTRTSQLAKPSRLMDLPVATQHRIEPGSVVTPLALISALTAAPLRKPEVLYFYRHFPFYFPHKPIFILLTSFTSLKRGRRL